MSKNSKRIFWNFLKLDYKAIEIYLSKMASKGWMLKEMYDKTILFKRIEPCKLRFYIDVYTYPSSLITSPIEEDIAKYEAYKSIWETAGWQYSTCYGHLQIFYSPFGMYPLPVGCDDENRQQPYEYEFRNNSWI